MKMHTLRVIRATARVAPLALLLCGAALHAQAPAGPRNAAYLELLGNGGIFSINFERRVMEAVALRAGIGHWTAGDLWSDAETTITSVPLVASRIAGAGRSRVEVGGGVVLGRRRWEPSPGAAGQSTGFTSLTGVIGYRFQPARRGWMFRIGFTPFFGLGDEDAAYPDRGFVPSFGASAGYAF